MEAGSCILGTLYYAHHPVNTYLHFLYGHPRVQGEVVHSDQHLADLSAFSITQAILPVTTDVLRAFIV